MFWLCKNVRQNVRDRSWLNYFCLTCYSHRCCNYHVMSLNLSQFDISGQQTWIERFLVGLFMLSVLRLSIACFFLRLLSARSKKRFCKQPQTSQGWREKISKKKYHESSSYIVWCSRPNKQQQHHISQNYNLSKVFQSKTNLYGEFLFPQASAIFQFMIIYCFAFSLSPLERFVCLSGNRWKISFCSRGITTGSSRDSSAPSRLERGGNTNNKFKSQIIYFYFCWIRLEGDQQFIEIFKRKIEKAGR